MQSDIISNQLHKKIEACSFPVDTGSFSCAEEHLTCPITLDIPKNGVFVKVSSQSDVCCLFDRAAFLNLVRQELKHPLSRESICMGMIVRKS
ncbi:T3SS effector NleG family protein, partial [Salmonella enterica subsp. enterica serovar Saintpaul]|nr:T3SS effector NleG family protein [Salmonella enterica subsp. enterica serovar Saintpaul]